MSPRRAQVYGAGWAPPKGTEGAGAGAHQTTLHHLSGVLANQEGPS